MKVKELIEKLLDLPMDKEVWFCMPDNNHIKVKRIISNVPQNKVFLE